jgi:hypothetical protein
MILQRTGIRPKLIITQRHGRHRHGIDFFSTGRSPHCPADTAATSCWQRGAVQIKNTNITSPYLEVMRQTHDPIQHVKTMEDELKGTIGRALGKQGEKILRAIQSMEDQFREYERLMIHKGKTETSDRTNQDDWLLQVHETARRYNLHREQALKARWELTVHRQAAGFLVDNHQYVVKAYPIANKLPESSPDCTRNTFASHTPTTCNS